MFSLECFGMGLWQLRSATITRPISQTLDQDARVEVDRAAARSTV